jgi:Zn-finger domain-containing protein
VKNNHLKNKAMNEFSGLHVDRLLHYNEQQLELMQVIRQLLEILDFSFDFKSIQQFNNTNALQNNTKNAA